MVDPVSGHARRTATRMFSHDEAGAVIETATRLQQMTGEQKAVFRDGLTYEQLVSVAAEFGIPEDQVKRAIAERNAPRGASKTSPKGWLRRAFYRHFAIYGSVMVGLGVIDAFDGAPENYALDWVMFPAAGWGMFLAIHASLAFFGNGRSRGAD